MPDLWSAYISTLLKNIYHIPSVKINVTVGKRKKESFTNWYLAVCAGDDLETEIRKYIKSEPTKFFFFTRKKRHLADVRIELKGEIKFIGKTNELNR